MKSFFLRFDCMTPYLMWSLWRECFLLSLFYPYQSGYFLSCPMHRVFSWLPNPTSLWIYFRENCSTCRCTFCTFMREVQETPLLPKIFFYFWTIIKVLASWYPPKHMNSSPSFQHHILIDPTHITKLVFLNQLFYLCLTFNDPNIISPFLHFLICWFISPVLLIFYSPSCSHIIHNVILCKNLSDSLFLILYLETTKACIILPV